MSHRSSRVAAGATGVRSRHRVSVVGRADGPAVVLAHGFGSDQGMWRSTLPHLIGRFRVVLYDLAGSGGSDVSSYDRTRHGALSGHAEDLLEICDDLDLDDVTLVGHSVSAMIVAIAAAMRPTSVTRLVLVAPSARYLDDPATGYVGGFSQEDVDELLGSLHQNYFSWCSAMAPMIMGPDRPDLGEELTASFCRTDPATAAHFARVLFTSDSRAVLPTVSARTLTLQCRNDVLAPPTAVQHVHRSIPGSTLVGLEARGHCPHVSAPAETARAITEFLS